MKNFTIENETNNITVHGSAKEAEAIPDSERFASEAALAKLAANWAAARLVEIWNSLPGASPVTKFKDRVTGVSRIWKAIQTLGVTPEENPEIVVEPELEMEPTATPFAPQVPDVAPEANAAKTNAARAKNAPRAETGVPREGSKISQVIAMLKREGGTTLDEIVTATSWQKHTTRAMLSAGGSLTKKHGLAIASEKVGDKRVYSIKA